MKNIGWIMGLVAVLLAYEVGVAYIGATCYERASGVFDTLACVKMDAKVLMADAVEGVDWPWN